MTIDGHGAGKPPVERNEDGSYTGRCQCGETFTGPNRIDESDIEKRKDVAWKWLTDHMMPTIRKGIEGIEWPVQDERVLKQFPRERVATSWLPIGGCVMQIQMPKERLHIAVTALLICHDHNFVVIQSPPAIVCSELAIECLKRAHADY